MLVAGNDRMQTIITQLEDSCRVTKVRGQNGLTLGLRPPTAAWSMGHTHSQIGTEGWGLEPRVEEQGWQ